MDTKISDIANVQLFYPVLFTSPTNMAGIDYNLSNHITVDGSPNYKIEQNQQLGRYLVASRDIKKGEVILRDQPLITGPTKASDLSCPGCYASPLMNCQKCGWPICSLECSGRKVHEQVECQVLTNMPNWSFQRKKDWNKLSNYLMILRCLLLKRTEQRTWQRLLEMETNWVKWCRSPHYDEAKQIEQLIREEYGLSETEFPSTDILKVQAILDINAFEVRLPDSTAQAAYKLAALVEHNCSPNTHKTICNKSLELTFRAATDIPCGTHISTTYCDTLWPTWHRQQFLQWSKFFICTCARCHSLTENGSHLASLICVDCLQTALPIFFVNEGWENVAKDYQCISCKRLLPAYECQLICKKADNELSELDKYASQETISTFEEWLDKWTNTDSIFSEVIISRSNNDIRDDINNSSPMSALSREKIKTGQGGARILLHPQHSLVLDACHTLFLLYPKEDCSLNELKRKECVGEHLLAATKPLFTGISKFRGTISYELAMTKTAILVHQLEHNGLTDNLQLLAEEVLRMLGESQELLKYEPSDQPEGKLAQTGASQLEQLSLFFSELFV